MRIIGIAHSKSWYMTLKNSVIPTGLRGFCRLIELSLDDLSGRRCLGTITARLTYIERTVREDLSQVHQYS